MTLSKTSDPVNNLPPPVSRFIRAMNRYDLEDLSHTFTAAAMVNDRQREHAGHEAIRTWLAQEIVGDRVRMEVREQLAHEAGCRIVAHVTGDYDKTHLPDPLTLRFYFSLGATGITQLVIIPESSRAPAAGAP